MGLCRPSSAPPPLTGPSTTVTQEGRELSMNRLLALSLALAAAVSVSACQTPQQQNALVGGTLGAGTGALVGSAVSGGSAGSTARRRRRSPSAAAGNGPTTITATGSASPSTEGGSSVSGVAPLDGKSLILLKAVFVGVRTFNKAAFHGSDREV